MYAHPKEKEREMMVFAREYRDNAVKRHYLRRLIIGAAISK
jgi:hypothetical protein